MTQFMRPDSNVLQTNFTGGFAEIDETTASDADFAYSANNTVATLRVELSNPLNPTYIPAGTCTVRYRIARVNSGVLSGTGNDVQVTASVTYVIINETTQATDTAKSTTGTWTTYSFTFNASDVPQSRWNNLRLTFTTTASGSGGNARGAGISWAEVEIPDAQPTRYTLIG